MDYVIRVCGTAVLVIVIVLGGMWLWEHMHREPVTEPVEPAPLVEETVSKAQPEEVTPDPVVQEASVVLATEPEDDPKQPIKGNGVITGTVVYLQGEKPVAGATVTVELLDWDLTKAPPADHFKKTTVSASNGTFEVRDLPIAPDGALYALRAERDEFGGNFVQGVPLSRATPKAEVKVTVTREYRITGTVSAIDGTPIENASLFVAKLGPQKLEVPPQAVTAGRTSSDADGHFTLRHNCPAVVFIWAVADGYPLVEVGPINMNATDVVITLPPPLKVSGQVLLKDEGTPLENILVRFTHVEYGTMTSATTDADGRFAIDAIGSGRYKTYLYHDTYVIADLDTQVVVSEGADVDDVILYATKGATLSGRVYDRDTGQGISSTSMKIASEQGNKFTETGSDGRYAFAGLPGCPVEVTLTEVDGYRVAGNERRKTMALTAGDVVENIDFPLSKGLTVSGIVLDPAGKPVADADVTAAPKSGNWFGARSNKDGRFEIVSLMPSNDYQVWARAEGYACPRVGPISVVDDSATGITVQLCEEATIEGRIVTPQGNPARNVGAYASSGEPGGTQADADAEGGFRLRGLHEGEYTVYAYRQIGYRFISNQKHNQQLTVREGQHVTDVTLIFEEEEKGDLAISGRVTDEKGNPVPLASIQVNGNWPGIHTNPEGYYNAPGLSEGENYFITVSATGYYSARQMDIAAGSEHIDFVLKKAASIEGQVVDARTQRPIQEFEMYVNEGRMELEPWMYDNFSTKFDKEGRFKQDNICSATYTFFFRAKGYAIQTVRVDGIQPGETRQGVLVALEPAVAIHGLVKDTTGKPVANARIFLGDVPERWQRDERGVTLSGTDGTFTVESVPEDVILMSAVHPNYAPGSGVIAADGDVEITLGQGGVIRGRITEGGKPVANAYVNTGRHTETEQFRGEGSLMTDVDGLYEFTGLVPDTDYYVQVRLLNSKRKRTETDINIVEGMETEVNFEFPAADAAIEGTVTINGLPPSSPVYVSITCETDAGQETSDTGLDKDGRFEFQNLLAGRIRVRVSAPRGDGQCDFRYVTTDTISGQVTQLDIDLLGGGVVNGAVVNFAGLMNGRVLAYEGVVEIPDMPNAEEFQAFQNVHFGVGSDWLVDDGTFRLTGLEAGTYTLRITAYDSAGLEAARNGTVQADAEYMRQITRTATVTVEVPAEGEVNIQVTLGN